MVRPDGMVIVCRNANFISSLIKQCTLIPAGKRIVKVKIEKVKIKT